MINKRQFTLSTMISVIIIIGCSNKNNKDIQNKTESIQLNKSIRTPPEVMKSLLDTIQNKDWQKACEYLSSSFLDDHKEEVLKGTYFAQTGGKDHSAFYSSDTKVNPQWQEQDNGKKAIVTIYIGGSSPDSLGGIGRIRLEKENGQWKVSEFFINPWMDSGQQ